MAERADERRKERARRGKPAKAPKGRRFARAGFWARAIVVLFFLGASGVLGFVGVLSFYGRDLPTVESLRHYDPPQITRVLDRNGQVLGEAFEERRTVVSMKEVPRVLVLSVLAAEDADFYRHEGLDYAGIARALVRDLFSGRTVQGASTITQQIVKNLLLTPERTVARKVKELILARRLEQELDKEQILHLYLNQIYFGHGRYGVQEASRFYFGKDVAEITLAEASLIAGIPQAPARLSPLRHPEASRARQKYVLDQLEEKRALYWDDLSLDAIRAARATKVALSEEANKPQAAPEVVAFARKLLVEQVGAEAAARGGYTIETTIDVALQRAARGALRTGLAAIDERQKLRGPLEAPKQKRKLERVRDPKPGRTYDAVVTGTDDAEGTIALDLGGHRAVAPLEGLERFNPEKLPPSAFAKVGARVRASVEAAAGEDGLVRARLELGPQGAAIVLDPRTREVLALVGSDRATFGFDRATQAVRQPGSTFKPIAYALALESKRFTPATLVLDAPEVFAEWKPHNYETWEHKGAVRLRQALAESINLVAVRVTKDLGPDAVVRFAQELGITSALEPTLALSLGASALTPLELVNAYATFAAGGRWAPPRIVRRIRRADGITVELPTPERARDVVSAATAYVLTSMLRSVVEEGTATAARKLRRPAAGKTGTSNHSRDAWFVGYTPELVAGVWVGFDDHRPLGKRESGAKSALPIWLDTMGAALGGKPVVDFAIPEGVETARIDPATGRLAYEGMPNAIDEVFLAGTAPTEVALPPDVLSSDGFLMEQIQGGTPAPE